MKNKISKRRAEGRKNIVKNGYVVNKLINIFWDEKIHAMQ
ncbi:hypothetical protein HMPREF9086_2690 [Enterobacter hormaechei ATCC 49162]|nr:hypothetical protein HMPREF9086_2690 [Enterobacter hormaechei ATCC 49162]